MVAEIAAGDVDQWDVMTWVVEQGQFMPSPTHQAVLFYLAANAFYREDNPEGEPVGTVLYQASRYEAIMAGTAIRTKATVHRTLNDLQEMAYVWREKRTGSQNQPLRIAVLWEARFDAHREGMRDGSKSQIPKLLIRPTRPRKSAEVVPLRAVEAVGE